MPCGDTLIDNSDPNEEISQMVDVNHNHSASDMCSPFCHCHCCHVHTIEFDAVEFEPINLLTPKLYIEHFDGKNKGYHISLLQPPQFIA